MSIFGSLIRRSYSSKMVQKHFVKGWDEFEKKVLDLEKEKKPINVFFTGDKDEQGVSWCPYCNTARPVIYEKVDASTDDFHFVQVDIDRPFWKDLENPFRKDPRTHLVFLPTLLRWKGAQRLDGSQAANPDLVSMLLEDED